MNKRLHGFTLIELLIVITVIGILSTIGITSYGRVQIRSRDSQREARLLVIQEALERYYLENGEYPSCSSISNPVSINTAAEILDLNDPSVLTSPTATKGTNSISCSSSNPSVDTYNLSGTVAYVIKYRIDETSSTGIINGRYGRVLSVPTNVIATTNSATEIVVSWDEVIGAVSYNVEIANNSGFSGSTFFNDIIYENKKITGLSPAQIYYFRVYSVSSARVISPASLTVSATTNPNAPSTPVVTTTLNGANVQATISSATCTGSTAQYSIRSRINDGAWSSYSAWNSVLIFNQAANDGVKYGYQAQTRCYIDASNYSAIASSIESAYIDPIGAPSTPVVVAGTVGATTTWSWSAISCSVGTIRYQYRYTISPSGFDSGWTSNGTNLSVAFTTSTVGQIYSVNVQAECYNSFSSGTWSPSGSASFVRVIESKVAVGYSHSCALVSVVYCWGRNLSGQVGDNSQNDTSTRKAVNTTEGVSSLYGKTVVSIATGEWHSCALANDGTVHCWGDADYGQLGDDMPTAFRKVPVAVSTTSSSSLYNKTVMGIDAGGDATCAVATDGTIHCWGRNNNGQMGDGLVVDNLDPERVTLGSVSGKSFKQISTGGQHVCALATDNTIHCWGAGGHGQLGDNTGASNRTAVAVNMVNGVSSLYGKTITSITVGTFHSCALTSDGKVHCWGDNGSGELGDNSTTDRLVPVAVSTANGVSSLYGKTVVSISAGEYYTCALASDNTTHCWGSNRVMPVPGEYHFGKLGINSSTTSYVMVPNLVNVTTGISSLYGKTIGEISTGLYGNTCVAATDNTIHCFGYNSSGQIGDTTTTDRKAAVHVTNL